MKEVMGAQLSVHHAHGPTTVHVFFFAATFVPSNGGV